MLKKIPIVGFPISLNDLTSGFAFLFKKNPQIELSNAILKFLNSKYVYFLNSATSSFYTILKVLKERRDKKEVILPAYTASSLVIAVKKADLTPVLCDISLDDFNMDANLLSRLVSKNTLCILGVHMFGIVAGSLKDLREKFPDVFIIEDCAQSLGSKIDGISVGGLADVSFFSFNRGKNLPTYRGGCIATNNEELAKGIEAQIRDVKEESFIFKLSIPFKLLALSLSVRPYFYGLFYPLISQFKEQISPEDFEVRRYTDFQAKVALSLLKRRDEFMKKRYYNGMKLIEGLKDIDGIAVPKIASDTEPAFNRLPVVFKDLEKRGEAQKGLWRAGMETSRMYFKPLHHIFNLGYKKEEFPNAAYFAEHLLTLPVHPLVGQKDLDAIVNVIKEILT